MKKKRYTDKELMEKYGTKVRVPMPKPTIWFKNKRKYDRKEYGVIPEDVEMG